MTRFIRHGGAIVAVAGPSRYYLAPDLEARPVGDRERVTVALMCAFAHAVATGRIPGAYSDARAEAYASAALALVDP